MTNPQSPVEVLEAALSKICAIASKPTYPGNNCYDIHAIARAALANPTISETPEVVGEPVAWLHTLHMEADQTMTLINKWNGRDSYDTKVTGFGIPGRDYSEEYAVTSEPLYRLASAPASIEVKS